MVVVAVPADAGKGVGGGPALRPQVVVVGGGRRRRVFVGMVVQRLRRGGLQAQFVVRWAGPAAARPGQRHQPAASARQRGAEHAGHELLVSGLGLVQRRPARLPLELPPALDSICGGNSVSAAAPAERASAHTGKAREGKSGAASGACSSGMRQERGWRDGTF